MTSTHTVNTNVGFALINAAMNAIDKGINKPVVEWIADAAGKNKHVIKRPDWNASLSFKTAQKLKKEGVLA